jgi:aminoglycoside N3'-acetyltransferase
MSLKSEEIKSKFQSFGFGRGNRIMVHSSLSSFGMVEGGAEAVIKALMELVGPEGTILMPSFNHNAPFSPSGPGVYDPKDTACTNGRIPDTFWRMEGVYRSLDPTHPFAAYGHDAERYTKNHHLTLTMGEESPLGLIALDGGYQINIGTKHHTTTAKHLAEMINRTPCLGYRTEAYPVRLPDGNVAMHRTWGWRERGCPLTDSGEFIEIEMEKRKLQKKGYICKSLVTYFRLLDLLKVILDMLDNGYAGYPACSDCSIRPRIVNETCPSDWKENGNVNKVKEMIKSSS